MHWEKKEAKVGRVGLKLFHSHLIRHEIDNTRSFQAQRGDKTKTSAKVVR